MSARVDRACAQAQACAHLPFGDLVRGDLPGEDGGRPDEIRARPTRRLAIGDPQAPMARFFAILDHNQALTEDGWLSPEVYLLSMGDHFDWGGSAEREQAADDGLGILAWLAAHPAQQVGLLLGNHDLGRMGELVSFTDEGFIEAHREAAAAYRGGEVNPVAEAALLERYPVAPTAELLARDFAAFTAIQRDLVAALLDAQRFRIAIAVDDRTLACHAGVTVDELAILTREPDYEHARAGHAGDIADSLQRCLDAAWARFRRGEHKTLSIPDLHRPGDSQFGEGGGMFYHRPTNPDHEAAPELLNRPYRRRYDARRLPLGFTQIVGHIADGKCRKLLGPWARATPTPPGAIRYLRTNGVQVSYGPGLPSESERASGDALMLFTDGRMARTAPEDYQLLDLSRLTRT